jgi:iron complex outermembrane receptor protein
VTLDGQPAGAPFLSAAAGVAARWPVLSGKADFSLQYGHGQQALQRRHTQTGHLPVQQRCRRGQSARESRPATGLDGRYRPLGSGPDCQQLTNKQYVSISTLGSATGSPYAYVSKPRVVRWNCMAICKLREN